MNDQMHSKSTGEESGGFPQEDRGGEGRKEDARVGQWQWDPSLWGQESACVIFICVQMQ